MIRTPSMAAAGWLLIFCALAGTAIAQDNDPFAELVFPPDLVMKHQAAIGLSEDQRRDLIAEVTEAQADLLPVQMEMAEHGELLRGLLSAPHVDEAAALSLAGQVMELETRIKRRHLELVIRIKNLLSEDQQARLLELRRE